MSAITERIDPIFEQFDKPDSPGCSLAILQDGEIVYARGYGMADLEHEVPISADSVFHVASVSKQFTAMAIALLVSKGTVDLDADIRTYVPEIPDLGHIVTVRHLVHHTSGIRDQWDLLIMTGWRLEDTVSNDDVLELVTQQRALSFPPGDDHVYSNTGYTLMAIIVERVTGKSFRQYTHEAIFEPLGMSDTLFHDNYGEIVKGRTSGHEIHDGRIDISNPLYSAVGASTLFTTAPDLMRWIDGLQNARLGGPGVIDIVTTPGVLNDGTVLDYAFGLSVTPYRGLRRISHAGGDAGYRSFVAWFPDQNMGIAVLSNLGTVNPSDLTAQVADVWLEDHFVEPSPVDSHGQNAPHVPAETLQRYSGLYRDQKARIAFPVNLRDDKLVLGIRSGLALIPVSQTEFRATGLPFQVTFDGHEIMEICSGSTRLFSLRRVTPAVQGDDDLAQYEGSYRSPELDVTYRIVSGDGHLTLQRRRQGELTLVPTVSDEFSGEGSLALIFVRNGEDRVTGFGLYTMRCRNVHFDRV